MQSGPPPWGPQHGPWGQPQQPWPPPQPWQAGGPPFNSPKKKGSGLVIAAVIFAVVGLPLLGMLVAGFIFWQRTRGAFTTAALDPRDVPGQLERHLPCKASCQVTNITLEDGWFSVSVVSTDVKDRTLLYRVYPHGAELGFSQDWPGGHPATFEYRDIDWSLATKLRQDLDREGINGKTVGDVRLMPCDYSKKDGPGRACMEASVLTSRGNETRRLDAKTGEVK
jgi:hypothetical protein